MAAVSPANAGFFLIVYVLYISAMFNVVGLPGLPYVQWDPTLSLVPFRDFGTQRFVWLSVMNVVMLVPLGFLLPQIWEGFRNFWVVLAVGFATSFGIEFLQLFSFRATDVDDLIFNTLGACIGFLLAKILTGKHWSFHHPRKEELLSLLCVHGIVYFFQFFLRYYVLVFLYRWTH